MKPFEDLFERLERSKFRSGFKLSKKDNEYLVSKGLDAIRGHSYEFVRTRLAPAEPDNDGRQTPMRGHPVFTAQHATATCCRKCVQKWHEIEAGRAFTEKEIEYVVSLICAWLEKKMFAITITSQQKGLFHFKNLLVGK